jgi:hypothetical protein
MENVVETSRWNLVSAFSKRLEIIKQLGDVWLQLASGLKLAGFNDVYEYR